ncbi:universal stress protein [Bizionia gelidisalsuginis]|uniref:Universal stress protein n=1 Tax=Bizionia gelidisalsuginis TaxID=291188 RepID=A0ABY3M7M7_9FLAO|nr:universal stress protein [Bizionia gelidisalsuginis]TYC09173.1 universal stress protein [Bizionia gelidisalsuginis]
MKINILLPTDFSVNAWSAALYAFKLYEKEDCTFHFLHSSNLPVVAMQNVSNKLARVMDENAKAALLKLKKIAEESKVSITHNFETIVTNEDLKDALETCVESKKIDLVVMGTKGATNATERFIGSNTVSIIKRVKNCPVLAVPDNFEFVNPKQIAFPTDFSRLYNTELLPLKQLAELFDSKIRIVHLNKTDDISEAQDYNLEQLKIALKQYSYTLHWIPEYDKKDQGIKGFIEELGVNILVMINYEHSFIENIMREPVIKKIGFHPTIPFLVIPCKS